MGSGLQLQEVGRGGNMKCPKCGSENTKLSNLIVTTNIIFCCDCQTYYTEWQQSEIDRLKQELAGSTRKVMLDAVELSTLTARLQEAADHIEYLLPMAKGYAHLHDVGSNWRITDQAFAWLESYRANKGGGE